MKKITIAKNAGFCFGVKRAIQLANNTSSKHKNVYMLGDIVHNPRVVNDIKSIGIKKIQTLKKTDSGVLLIRAHGAPKSIYLKARQKGYTIIDATCPMVKEIHEQAKQHEKSGYRIIIIGDKHHDEVMGIKGNLKKNALIIDSAKQITPFTLKGIKKAAVVVQSTQNLEKVLKIVEKLSKYIEDLLFCNTICHPTRQKQKEIQSLPLSQDIMIIIGAKSSANTKRLFELSHALNPKTYWVNSKRSLKKEWFKGKNKIGIAAGASTPDYIIKEIEHFIQSL